MADPKMGYPGMTGLYLALDLVRPGGSLLCCNSTAVMEPHIFRGYLGALAVGRSEGSGSYQNSFLGWGLEDEGSESRKPLQLQSWLCWRDSGEGKTEGTMKLDKSRPVDGQLPGWVHLFHRK